MSVGIYQIKNIVTGAKYIGESVNLRKRKAEHIRDLDRHSHSCKALQKAWNRTPSICFRFRIKELFLFTNHFVNRDKLILMLFLREAYHMRMADVLYNTEDTGSMLKSFALNGNFEGRFKRYKRYRRWVKKRLVFMRRWMPHILVAAQYNYVVRLFLYALMGVIIWGTCYYCLPTSVLEWVVTRVTNIFNIVRLE